MRGFLIDTCVVSEPTRARPSEKVRAWLDATAAESLFLSVATLSELERGIAALGGDAKARKLERWMNQEVLTQFESRILDVDRHVARRWGLLLGEGQRKGRPPALVDALLAATALEYGLALVTRNVADFARFGMEIVNPWQ